MDRTPTTPASPNNRPRPRSRGISFRSDKSVGSDGNPKLTESPREKAQRDSIWKEYSKSNPNAAINEAQPGVAHLNEQSTLQNLREFEHRDASGNVIADPDRSNPTRPRMERPLDTIRSFERAIDDGYRRRTSYMRQDSENWDRENQFASRRSSYFGGYENGPSPNRSMQGSGGGYYGGQGYYNGGQARRYPGNRMASDPQLYGQRSYPQHNYHQSHDTVNTGGTNGSDSTGPWANSTDPSSESSSIDKVHAMNKPPTPMDPYGNGNGHNSNGYNPTIMEEHGGGMYGDYWQQANGNGYPKNYPVQDNNGYGQPNGHPAYRDMYLRNNSNPTLQQPQPSQARRPIQLGGSSTGDVYDRQPSSLPPQTKKEPEKRQSWLKRRFSKKT